MSIPPADAWPRQPIEGVTGLLQPVAQVLNQARNELPTILGDLSADDLWAEPAGLPSIGFHLAHVAGNLDRLFTHARGQPLSRQQRERLTAEGAVSRVRPTLADLLGRLDLVLENCMTQLRGLPPERLLETRDIGVDGCFSTVFDIVSSAAEHTSRHLGQIATTARVLRHRG